MAIRLIEFDPGTLADLFCHYTEGKTIPLGAKILNWGIHPVHNRMLGFLMEAEWEDAPIGEEDLQDKSQIGGLHPIQLRYEGKKCLTWSKGDREEPVWNAADNFRDQRGER
jgi:hypothetical protein